MICTPAKARRNRARKPIANILSFDSGQAPAPTPFPGNHRGLPLHRWIIAFGPISGE